MVPGLYRCLACVGEPGVERSQSVEQEDTCDLSVRGRLVHLPHLFRRWCHKSAFLRTLRALSLVHSVSTQCARKSKSVAQCKETPRPTTHTCGSERDAELLAASLYDAELSQHHQDEACARAIYGSGWNGVRGNQIRGPRHGAGETRTRRGALKVVTQTSTAGYTSAVQRAMTCRLRHARAEVTQAAPLGACSTR